MNWEYISGFFDADGSVTATSPQKGKNKTIQISFHNTELSILEEIRSFILEELEIKGTISVKKTSNPNWNTSYDLKYLYQNGLKVANKMNSFHPKKKHRIKIYNLIQKKTKRNGKYSENEKQERLNLLDEFFKH